MTCSACLQRVPLQHTQLRMTAREDGWWLYVVCSRGACVLRCAKCGARGGTAADYRRGRQKAPNGPASVNYCAQCAGPDDPHLTAVTQEHALATAPAPMPNLVPLPVPHPDPTDSIEAAQIWPAGAATGWATADVVREWTARAPWVAQA